MTETAETKRIALVTGASRGIGRAAAIALARAGCHVILSARTSGGVVEVDDEITAAGGTASILKLDLIKSEIIDALGPTLFNAGRGSTSGAEGRSLLVWIRLNL
jgi:NAD(P)-dependent dehydrogenase (short-subunit alcohol dehydrogenase family)